MSEKKARQKRQAKAKMPAPTPPPEGTPGTTVADLLQLLGSKDVEILGLQRQVAGLRQQVQTLAEQLAEKENKSK